jgi:uncharacterized cupin superfamily protein
VSEPKTVLNIADLPVRTGSGYPEHYAKAVKGRSSISLGNPLGLTQFGVNVTTLEPGAWSSQRHWHLNEDELVMALEGEMVIVDEEGRHPFIPGLPRHRHALSPRRRRSSLSTQRWNFILIATVKYR